MRIFKFGGASVKDADGIHNMYNKTTYLDKYGGSTIVTALILFVFFTIFSYNLKIFKKI
mgnify:CR=1 FL=1